MSTLHTIQVPVEKCVGSPLGLMVAEKTRLLSLPEYKEGLFEIQDESSQIIAQQVDVRPGEKVLDFCGGSGGKSLAFGPQMQNLGVIYVHDVRDSMLRQAKLRLRRAGVKNYMLLHPRHPYLGRILRKCDWVLVDAPCTGSGTYRRNPEQKWSYSDELLWKYVAQQREIFADALRFVKPGGTIVYATCSILDEENIDQVKYFCAAHGIYLTTEPVHALPQSRSLDGFFCACLHYG